VVKGVDGYRCELTAQTELEFNYFSIIFTDNFPLFTRPPKMRLKETKTTRETLVEVLLKYLLLYFDLFE
jgi:hypothetical protein